MAAALLVACSGDPTDDGDGPTDGGVPRSDADKDGFDAIEAGGTDCNDDNAAIHPTAPEFCDGVDSDCNGVLDDDDAEDALILYEDADEDGYGDNTTRARSCAPIDGTVANGNDCNDLDEAIHPQAAELCNEGQDDDCNPATLETAMVGALGFASLQDAVNVVADGGEVTLCDGVVHARQVQITRAVTSTSASGTRAGTTLDAGSGNGPIFLVGEDGELTLRALTVAHATQGAVDALSVPGGAVIVEDCLFDANAAPGTGGAIAGTTVTISDSDFTSNSATIGGALFVTTPGAVTITDSTVTSNTASRDGGAIATATQTTLDGVELRSNSATDGGALHVTGAQVQILGGIVEENTATAGGGVELAFNAAIQVSDADFGVGASDNLPDDIFLDGPDDESFATFGDRASFTCSSGTTCVPTP
jgi:predicted outer membrane repeat protein